MVKLKSLLILILITYPLLNSQLKAQNDDDFFMRDDTTADFVGITKYDAFCPVLEGDSVRFCGKGPCTGWIKEFYIGTEKLIHEGSYEFGRITNSFTNYFISGKIERSFVKKPNGDFYSLHIFDSLGIPISQTEYYRTTVIKRKDYYRNGNMELDEVYEKKGKYIETQKYYYPNGKLYSELLLTDSRKNSYSYSEYYPSGKIKIQGFKIRNPEINDYFNHSKWIYFEENGTKIKEDIYIKGSLSE
jgi:antitoxin component YwqK of YwqJK toxin-antitoxin module